MKSMSHNLVAFILVVLIVGVVGVDYTLHRPTTALANASLDGTWKSDSPSMTATVSGNSIQIDFVGDNMQGLYWKGTLPTPSGDGATIVSQGDVEAMDSSMFGSQSKTKAFVYRDGRIEFPFTILGTTTTVRLER